MNEPEIKLLDQKQVALILGKSTAWCERSRWNGTGPPYRKIGRAVRYEEQDVYAWIKRHEKRVSTVKVGGCE